MPYAPGGFVAAQLGSSKVKLAWTHPDHLSLLQYVLEKFDKGSRTWKPYDDRYGIVKCTGIQDTTEMPSSNPLGEVFRLKAVGKDNTSSDWVTTSTVLTVENTALDATSVDGHLPSVDDGPDTVVIRDEQGVIHGDLSGNADTATDAHTLDGKHGSEYADKQHSHPAGDLTGLNNFGNVKIGNTEVDAEGAADTIEFIAGPGVQLSADASGKSVTIGMQGDLPQAFVKMENFDGGQTSYTLTQGTYVPGANSVSVYVGGVKQVSGVHYTETSTTVITLSEAAPAGTKNVEIVYLQVIPEAGGTVAHSLDGFFLSADPTPNTIPLRDENGDIPGLTSDTALQQALDGKAARATNSATVTQDGWYRIAQNGPVTGGGSGGDRAGAVFTIRDTRSGCHSITNLYASVLYGQRPTISLMNRTWYGNNGCIQKVRLVEAGTYEGAALEVYVKTSAGSADVSYTMYDNEAVSGWTATDWSAGLLPEGFTATQLDFDTYDMVMGSASAGNSNAFYVLRDGTVGKNGTNYSLEGHTHPDMSLDGGAY